MTKDTKEAAIEVFERYPNAKEVFITPDNQVFLAKDRALLHDKDVLTVKRREVIEETDVNTNAKKDAPKKADELIAEITDFTLEQISDLEATSEKRATVLKAIQDRKDVIATNSQIQE